jgi:hypothetical protein
MKTYTFLYAGSLLLLGIAGYALTGAASITALIPAFFSAPVFVCGLLYGRENLRKHVMHAALGIAILAFAGSVSAVPKLFVMLSGAEVERPAAVLSRSVMTLLSAAFLTAGAQSFIAARRQK